MAVISAATFFLACGLALVCCTRPTAPAVSATPPRGDAPQPDPAGATTQPANAPAARPQARSTPIEPAPAEIDMETPEEPEPRTPRYLEIVDEIRADGVGTVRATVTLPSKLELETDNVKRLRITREGLPLATGRSIVVRIDGQGIEWTRQYTAVELERSSAGTWTVVGRRPSKKP